MAMYKKVGVSPLGGCLPMLVQLPILFAMFRFFPSSIELRQEAFLWADDLSSYDAILSWDFTIPIISQFYGNHISLFTDENNSQIAKLQVIQYQKIKLKLVVEYSS